MLTFLAGGSGILGRRLIPRLVAAGHRVVATTRTPEKAERLRSLGAEPVVLDALNPAAVGEAVAQAAPEAILHEMTALSVEPDMRHFDDSFAMTNLLRTRGTDHLLDAARASGVRRFVAQSFTGWPNERQGGPVKSEEDPFDRQPPKSQRRTLEAIRYLEQAVVRAPLEGVVMRYGFLYGPEASDALVEMVRARRLPLVGGGGGVWSWTHVDDAAAATVAALEGDRTGVYNIVDDDPAPVAEWLPYLADALGAKPPLRLPAWMGRLAAGEAIVSMMTRARGSSNQKAKRELGWAPMWPSWRSGFVDGLEV